MRGRLIHGRLHWMGRARFGRGYGRLKLQIGLGTSFGGLPVTPYLPSKTFDIVMYLWMLPVLLVMSIRNLLSIACGYVSMPRLCGDQTSFLFGYLGDSIGVFFIYWWKSWLMLQSSRLLYSRPFPGACGRGETDSGRIKPLGRCWKWVRGMACWLESTWSFAILVLCREVLLPSCDGLVLLKVCIR